MSEFKQEACIGESQRLTPTGTRDIEQSKILKDTQSEA